VDAETRTAVETALAARVTRTSRVGGGDINDAFEARLDDGRTVFVKTNERADPTLFPAEARGLSWLAEARALRVPEVLAVSSGRAGRPSFLVLEHIASARPRAGCDEELGRGLAALHRFGAASFGLDHDNFIGRLPQSNQPSPSWADFYRSRRLEPQLGSAVDAGLGDRALQRGFDTLFGRLPELVGPGEPPARLHGDLWGGNLHIDDRGAPCIIDPAVYGGHREVDLAMMKLFGGFGSRVFEAYDEAFPLEAGHDERVPLYQLYPLLVHVNLFGASYVGSVRRALAHYV
jgi:fructosamine-3-kinase